MIHKSTPEEEQWCAEQRKARLLTLLRKNAHQTASVNGQLGTPILSAVLVESTNIRLVGWWAVSGDFPTITSDGA
jgi:hypothetical protein